MQKQAFRTVLMADDDPEDCLLANEALVETGAVAAFTCVGDGVELMEYLYEHSSSSEKKKPNLILLDLNMPKKDGRKALAEIKSEPALQDIPIVILTTSREPEDLALMLRNGAESFFTKPASFDGWISMMKSLAEKWLG